MSRLTTGVARSAARHIRVTCRLFGAGAVLAIGLVILATEMANMLKTVAMSTADVDHFPWGNEQKNPPFRRNWTTVVSRLTFQMALA